MDQLLSQLIPSQRIGNDGFNWWVGQIEGTASDEENNKGGYRYKVRIVGDHPQSKEVLDTPNLPWANVVMPVNVPFMPGNTGGGHPQLKEGCWVIGFYIDHDRQKPLILGSIGQTPGATAVINEERPENKPFTTAIPADVNVKSDGVPEQEGTGKNTGTGGLSDGTTDGEGKPRVAVPEKKKKPTEKGNPQSEEWCQAKAEKCDDPDITSEMTIIMGEFLAQVQSNGGNIGTYLVNEATGALNEATGIARNYVNKAMKVVTEFIAKVKGYILQKLTNAVTDLINATIYPSEEGNSLTPVTEWFNSLLKDLGCQMADLGDRLAEWLTNLLMSYVEQIYKSVICQVDELVNGIISKINEFMEDILSSVLGPLQEILGAIAAPLNILGGAINYVLTLLGISCSGPNNECSKYKQICTDGEKKEGDDGDFLDNLLDDIDNLFGDTPADYTQYVCDEAYEGTTLAITTVGFTGGVPLPADSTNPIGPGTNPKKKKKIVYEIFDIEVEEGQDAVFSVVRTGSTEYASSVKYKTIKDLGTATPGEDYLEVEDILGFAPGETFKTFSVKTFYSQQSEPQEDFYVKMTKNSPSGGSGISSSFIKNIGKCTIKETAVGENTDPYKIKPVNPFTEVPKVFPPDETDIPSEQPENDGTGFGIGEPTYNVQANRTVCPEGEFIVYTITTSGIENGEILYYTLLGNGITKNDIIGGDLTGSFIISNNTAKVTIGIEEDDVVEDEEVLTFTVNGTGASADVVITSAKDIEFDDYDESEGITEETTFDPFVPPTVTPEKIITDETGGIIEIPIDDPGDPWAEPPYVFIGGEGIGASATALLDRDGFLTEIRIKSSGYGYKKNLASDNGVRCIIDTFTLIRPGVGYKDIPDVYVDGELGVAEALINEDGFVIGARVLDRTRTFDKFPKITIVGGGGYGAKLLPSLVCLDTQELSTRGSTKIGTGRYVDCP